MEKLIVIFVFSLCAFKEIDCKKNYKGYHLFSIDVKSQTDLNFIRNLEKTDSLVDLWSEPRATENNTTISVAPGHVENVKTILQNEGIKFHIISNDLQALIERANSTSSDANSRTSRRRFRLDDFHTHEEINTLLDNLPRRCAINFGIQIKCEVITIGESYEGRPLKVLHIFPGDSEVDVRKIWIDAGIHAREWGAPATAVYLMFKLLNLNPYDELLTKFEWYILPSANPDGYMYSINEDRMWRKTRSDQGHCTGVDPNRNWDFHWREIGASSNPCDDTYAGPTPFSEIETKEMSNYLKRFMDGDSNDFLVYLSLHAYGKYWMTPWGYTPELPDDYDDLITAANAAVRAIRRVSGERFTTGSSTNVLYEAAGGSDDWAKGVAQIKYSYTVELRDNGWYGFLMPRNEIKRSGEEIWAGVKAMMESIMEIENI